MIATRSGSRAAAERSSPPIPKPQRRSAASWRTTCAGGPGLSSPRRARVAMVNAVSTVEPPQAGYPAAGPRGPAAGSADLHAGDGPRHHQSLDLRRAFEDRIYLRVTVPAFDGVFTQVPGATEDLHRLLGHRDGHLAGLQLAHRALAGREDPVVAAHPRRPPHQQPGRVDLGAHV